MPRYKLIIEYDGTPFSGWQIQDNAPTVQGALEDAVKAICGEAVRVHGSGRTDAGVHALAQVAHCDIRKPFPPGRCATAERASAPHPIGVLSAEIVADDFEARFSPEAPLPLPHHQPPRQSRARYQAKLAGAAPSRYGRDARRRQALLGKHDFTTFRDTECQAKSPEKTLDQLDVIREGDAVSISLRALVPAQPGALDGGLAGLGRRRPLERRRPRRRTRRPQPRRLRPRGARRTGLYLVRVEY
jgi:tRNA pseudouridine38-40 synthase